MAKLQISIDDELKNEAEDIIDQLGLTPKTAITVFYKQILEQGKIPFPIELSQRNKLTLSIQKSAKELPVKTLDTDEKILEWLEEDDE